MYFCRVLNSEQKKTNPISLDQRLLEESSMGDSSNFGGLLGVGAKGGGIEKKSLNKKKKTYIIIQ